MDESRVVDGVEPCLEADRNLPQGIHDDFSAINTLKGIALSLMSTQDHQSFYQRLWSVVRSLESVESGLIKCRLIPCMTQGTNGASVLQSMIEMFERSKEELKSICLEADVTSLIPIMAPFTITH